MEVKEYYGIAFVVLPREDIAVILAFIVKIMKQPGALVRVYQIVLHPFSQY